MFNFQRLKRDWIEDDRAWCLHVIIDPWVNSMSGVWNVGFLQQCYIIDHSSSQQQPEPDYRNVCVYSAPASSKSCHVGDVRMLRWMGLGHVSSWVSVSGMTRVL